VEAHNSEEDVALEKEAISRVGWVDEENEGVYDPSLKRTKEEQAAWQIDRTFETETNWGVNNKDLEVVSRVSLRFASPTRLAFSSPTVLFLAELTSISLYFYFGRCLYWIAITPRAPWQSPFLNVDPSRERGRS